MLKDLNYHYVSRESTVKIFLFYLTTNILVFVLGFVFECIVQFLISTGFLFFFVLHFRLLFVFLGCLSFVYLNMHTKYIPPK